ncbi:MAG: PhzF family phenazine biosynthesis protein [Actinomycetes bacterium]
MTLPGPTLEYLVVDVFTDRAYSGNPLAVVLGGEGLTSAQMQAVASEFHLSETAFPLWVGALGDVDYQLRIFTPTAELPFAGHPSVGAAWVLAYRELVPVGPLRQRCGAGDLGVRVELRQTDEPGPAPRVPGRVWLDGAAPSARRTDDPQLAARVATAVGLGLAELRGEVWICGAGLDFCYLGVHPSTLGRASATAAGLTAVSELAGLAGLVVHTLGSARVQQRVFAPDIGVVEDPATGSAALGLVALAVATGHLVGDGEHELVVEQGAWIGRGSRMTCAVRTERGRPVAVSVAGEVVPVAVGRIRVPPVT